MLSGAWQKISPAPNPCAPGERRHRVSSVRLGIEAHFCGEVAVGPAAQTVFAVFSTRRNCFPVQSTSASAIPVSAYGLTFSGAGGAVAAVALTATAATSTANAS